jgi:hypothetical protein
VPFDRVEQLSGRRQRARLAGGRLAGHWSLELEPEFGEAEFGKSERLAMKETVEKAHGTSLGSKSLPGG